MNCHSIEVTWIDGSKRKHGFVDFIERKLGWIVCLRGGKPHIVSERTAECIEYQLINWCFEITNKNIFNLKEENENESIY